MKEEFNIEVGQWVVLKTGEVIKITPKNQPENGDIERYATQKEILENGGGAVELELRMYFFVPYNISPIQKGIQAGHAMGDYILKYGAVDPNHPVWEFLEKWKTWIILDGGTTNNIRDFKAVSRGTLNQIADALNDNDIQFGYFVEPDLNDALSAVCFICDERVFNKEDYPDFADYLCKDLLSAETISNIQSDVKSTPVEEWEETYKSMYTEWRDDVIGGHKNLFLRELIRNKKFA